MTDEPAVLELRVHGVGNTTAASLLDLRPDQLELVMGDKLGSFWRPKDGATAALESGEQGYIPPGIRREAYSWGGMVRTTPDLGGSGGMGAVGSVLARIGYALLLPFAIGNVVQWTRRLPPAPPPLPDPPPAVPPLLTEKGSRTTAGLTRVFGLLLTLLFTCAAVTITLDLGAAQCAAAAALCTPAAEFFTMFAGWTAGQRLALFALGPVLAAGLLWILSTMSRQRYDVLPGMGGHRRAREGVRGVVPPEQRAASQPTALLSSPGFWANRVTRHLAHAHFAAAILFTVVMTAGQAAFGLHTNCHGLGGWDHCVGTALKRLDFDLATAALAIGMLGLVAVTVVVFLLPTTVPVAEERIPAGASTWADVMLLVSVLVFIGLEIALVFATGPRGPDRLYGGGAAPLVIVSLAVLVAASGIFWRARAGRRATAWLGCAPAAFMSAALVVAASMCAIVTTTVGDWLNGVAPASALVRGVTPRPGTRYPLTLHISSSYVALGFGIIVAVVILLLVAFVMLIRPRNVSARAAAWGAPTTVDDLHYDERGVLPPARTTLLAWVQGRRGLAARVHLAEPIGGAAAILLSVGVVGGAIWAWVAYAHAGTPLWDPTRDGGWWSGILHSLIDLAMLALAWGGLAILAIIVTGASAGASRPIAIVWDVICYLPRTGHPFGPPAYAERAVPEIAGRLFEWLDAGGETDPDKVKAIEARRAVLVGHSMGGVLIVSALGLLASSPRTRPVLQRVALLTFGVQLRAFFGRLFPELLGPGVLGTEPSRAPRAFTADSDPWSVDFEQTGLVDRTGGRLVGTLLTEGGVEWRSLWRPTDMLGFVANGPHPNAVDVLADEIDLSGYMVAVDGHDVYYRAPQYQQKLLELAGLPAQ